MALKPNNEIKKSLGASA